jgi:hypothetical protein
MQKDKNLKDTRQSGIIYICMKKYGIHEWSFGDKPLFFFMATSKLLTKAKSSYDWSTFLGRNCYVHSNMKMCNEMTSSCQLFTMPKAN